MPSFTELTTNPKWLAIACIILFVAFRFARWIRRLYKSGRKNAAIIYAVAGSGISIPGWHTIQPWLSTHGWWPW